MRLEVNITVRDKDAGSQTTPLFEGTYDPEKELPVFRGWYDIKEKDPLKQPWMVFIDPPEGVPIDEIRNVLTALYHVCDQKMAAGQTR